MSAPPPAETPPLPRVPPFRVRASELESLALALQAALEGRFVDRLWAPRGDTVLVRLGQGHGDHRRLLLDACPTHPRATYCTRWPETPPTPTRAALTLRRALEGARVVGVTPWRDRGLDVKLTRGDGPRVLRVQLAGRFPNVAVLGPPPTGESEPDAPVLATLLANRPPFDPRSPPLPAGPPRIPPAGPVSSPAGWPAEWIAAWEAYTSAEVERLARARRAQRVDKALRAAHKRLRRRLRALDRDEERARQGALFRQRGELLKGLLGQIPRGASEVTARDWSQEGAPEVPVPLDPALSAADNMRRYFQRYRKAARAAAPIARRRAEAEQDLQRLRAARATLADALRDEPPQADEALTALERAWGVPAAAGPTSAPGRQQRPHQPPRREPFYRFRGTDGAEILVGRSARDNDTLTFRHARGRDIWLHLRDGPGSHVILRHDAQDTPPTEAALRDAALLAAWYSSARGEPVVDVLWTRRKHVRRPPGAPPGKVTVADAKTRAVRSDPARLQALHGHGAGDGPPLGAPPGTS